MKVFEFIEQKKNELEQSGQFGDVKLEGVKNNRLSVFHLSGRKLSVPSRSDNMDRMEVDMNAEITDVTNIRDQLPIGEHAGLEVTFLTKPKGRGNHGYDYNYSYLLKA